MKKIDFLQLMKFPKEWFEWDMYPDELFEWQISHYLPGHEQSSEHDRNGAFHWWLKREMNQEQILKLESLARKDPDKFLSKDILIYISNTGSC